MNLQINQEQDIRLVSSKRNDGECFYDISLPLPTTEVIKIIGETGVAEIDSQLKKLHEWKKGFYGPYAFKEQLGLSSRLDFLDFNTKAILAIRSNEYDKSLIPKVYPKLDLVIPTEMKRHNFRLLKEQAHYIIRIREVLDEFFNEYVDEVFF